MDSKQRPVLLDESSTNARMPRSQVSQKLFLEDKGSSHLRESLTTAITAAIGSRYAGNDVFQREVRDRVVEGLGWTFLGNCPDIARLGRLATLVLIADLGCIASMQRYGHTVEPGKAGQSIRSTIQNGLDSMDGTLSLHDETVNWLRCLALSLAPDDQLLEHWQAVRRHDLSRWPDDRIGPLWETLMSADKRRGSGSFFTGVDPIDLIVGFCISDSTSLLLDPACGSGAFLVRALSRLNALDSHSQVDMAGQIHGIETDALSLRLAANNIFSRSGMVCNLRHNDFFSIRPETGQLMDAVVGNPPYTRQEVMDHFHSGTKERTRSLVLEEWDFKHSAQSGLHVPFVMHGLKFLRPGGRLGMILPNAWLNARYGDDLKRFLLERTRVIAVVEPGGERWFHADVNPIILIVEKATAPQSSGVRFVRLKQPLADLIGADPASPRRWNQVERLVARIEGSATFENHELRINVVEQSALMPRRNASLLLGDDRKQNASKWAVNLGLPSGLSELLSFGHKWCLLRDLATVRRGLTTGANKFFYVKVLRQEQTSGQANPRQIDVLTIESGDGARHQIESRFLRPIVRSPREIPGYQVDETRLAWHVVLLPDSIALLTGTKALEYIRYGEQAAGARSVHLRRTCASRRAWWSLTPSPVGKILWCKTHFARHIVPSNEKEFLTDCNLYHMTSLHSVDGEVFAAMLNSSLIALQKELYGRANLGQGALKTEVLDVLQLPVPDVRRFSARHVARLKAAQQALGKRSSMNLLSEIGREDRQELDKALLAAMGFEVEAQHMFDRLYEALRELMEHRLIGRSAGRYLGRAVASPCRVDRGWGKASRPAPRVKITGTSDGSASGISSITE